MRASATYLPKLRSAWRRFATDAGAATAIEYALMAAGVGAAVAGSVYALGSAINETFYDKIRDAMN